jgi:YidC/Oxa1 family membrane protein insertase
MDKKTIIGLLLMVAIFVGFSFYESHKAEEYNEWKKGQLEMQKALEQEQEAQRKAEQALTAEELAARDSMERVRIENAELYKYGSELKAARNAKAEVITLSNDFIKVDFTTKGGKIANVTLLDERYTRYADGERTDLVEMMQPESARFYTLLKTKSGEKVNSNEFTFTPTLVKGEDGTQKLTMRLELSDKASLSYVYTIYNTWQQQCRSLQQSLGFLHGSCVYLLLNFDASIIPFSLEICQPSPKQDVKNLPRKPRSNES